MYRLIIFYCLSILDGLKKYYGAKDGEDTLKFFEVHQSADIIHRQVIKDLMALHFSKEEFSNRKANVLKLLADNPQGTVVIQADETASADAIIQVMDGARDAGVYDISLAAEPN